MRGRRRKIVGEATEVVLDGDDIQGNALAGFCKDRQLLVALAIRDRGAAKAWLARIAPHLSSLSEVAAFNALFRSKRRRLGHDPAGLIATWANVAFSHAGLAVLTSQSDADGVPDEAFRDGLPARAGSLGDAPPPDGAPLTSDWVVGGEGRVPDILLVVASDEEEQLKRVADQLRPGAGDLGGAPAVVWEELGNIRSDLPGHEHFGFKDGISQPGARGRLSRSPDTFLTPRELASPAGSDMEFARPGTPLVWPGQFVFGYPSCDGSGNGSVPAPTLEPPWIRNGSLLVFRRLRQDVAAFHAFLRAAAASLAATDDFRGMTPERLGAVLVGRWPSGAPVARTPFDDDPALGRRAEAANDFLFIDDTPAPRYRPGAGTPDGFPRAKADPAGFVCPHAAHVRKVNPRDQDSDKGDRFDTLKRRILRRGIPYGPPMPAPPGGQLPKDDGVDRGLHFLSYQTSIVEQFEVLQSDWANSPNNPKPGGHDAVIGQDPQGERHVELLTSAGGDQVLPIQRAFVSMTGGGYFFAPSISAIRDVLARPG